MKYQTSHLSAKRTPGWFHQHQPCPTTSHYTKMYQKFFGSRKGQCMAYATQCNTTTLTTLNAQKYMKYNSTSTLHAVFYNTIQMNLWWLLLADLNSESSFFLQHIKTHIWRRNTPNYCPSEMTLFEARDKQVVYPSNSYISIGFSGLGPGLATSTNFRPEAQ